MEKQNKREMFDKCLIKNLFNKIKKMFNKKFLEKITKF